MCKTKNPLSLWIILLFLDGEDSHKQVEPKSCEANACQFGVGGGGNVNIAKTLAKRLSSEASAHIL